MKKCSRHTESRNYFMTSCVQQQQIYKCRKDSYPFDFLINFFTQKLLGKFGSDSATNQPLILFTKVNFITVLGGGGRNLRIQ